MNAVIFRFGPAEQYSVRMASDTILRIKAYSLVYDIYRAQGYAGPSEAGRWVTIC